MYTTRGEYTEWHLTPREWERGTEVTDSSRKQKDTPADRVLTYKYSEKMSKLEIYQNCDEIWTSGDESMIASLKEQFGECPCRL
jgi:hypothetical protein